VNNIHVVHTQSLACCRDADPDVVVVDDVLFVDFQGMHAFSLAEDPAQPTPIATTISGGLDLDVHDDRLYVASFSGLVWYDVSDPRQPVFVDSLNTNLRGVSVADGVAYGRHFANPQGYIVLEVCSTPADTDGDGLIDGDELALGTDPNNPDTDGDGLSDGAEVLTHLTDPLDADTDNDGLSDGDEIGSAGMGCTDPLVADSDGDGLSDGAEVLAGLNPCDTDSDMDGLADGLEAAHGTDPLVADSDGDGLLDGTEVDMQALSGVPDCPNPAFGGDDSDGDTLSDGDEVTLGTDPCSTDTDGDTIADNIDDLPLTPGVSSGFIESDLRALCTLVKGLNLENFTAPNNNARKGRRNAICNKLNSAAKKVAQGDFASARDQLHSLLQKVDDENQPPDWMVHVGMDPTGKDVVRDDVELMIFLIELVL